MLVVSSNPEQANRPFALTIAGFDPSSGAGITADLSVFSAHRICGLAAITALTVQSTQGVLRVEPISPELLRQTLDCLAEDLPIAGVKIGMLASDAVVGVVAAFLAQSGIPVSGIVLDPVLKSSSGHDLLSREGLERLKADLLPRVGWITPNLDELAALTDRPVSTREAVPEAAARLASHYPSLNIAVTGGHLDPPDDFLRIASGPTQWLAGRRIDTTATHGTGCAFSSALLARLLDGDSPVEAAPAAKAYVAAAMRAAKPMGKGHGALNHLYALD